LQNIVFHHLKLLLEAGVTYFYELFNELNGIPATGNKYLQRQILKEIGVLTVS
jgi:beta-glucosidase